MEGFKEFQGRTLDEAIGEACAYFDTAREKLEIDIIQDSKSGIFGLVGARKAKVRARRVALRSAVEGILGRTREDESIASPPSSAVAEVPSSCGCDEAKSGPDCQQAAASLPLVDKAAPSMRGGQREAAASLAAGNGTRPNLNDHHDANDRKARSDKSSRPEQMAKPLSTEPTEQKELAEQRGSDARAEKAVDQGHEGSRQDRGRSSYAPRSEESQGRRRPSRRAGGEEQTNAPGQETAGRQRNAARTEQTDRNERPERAGRPERTERPARPERAERPMRPERVARPERQEAEEHDDVEELQRIPFEELDKDRLRELSLHAVRRLVTPIVGDMLMQVDFEDGRVCVRLDCGSDSGLLIGREGQTLAALQYLASRLVSRGMNAAVRVQLDAGEYRLRQDEKLREMALVLAEKVRTTGKSHSTRPLSSYHRRIVHVTLQDDADVQTRSSGDGILKRVIVQRKR